MSVWQVDDSPGSRDEADCLYCTPLLVLLASPAHAQLTGVAVNIPGSAFGTWELQMEAATAASPYANKSAARLTIAIDGSLCPGGF